LDEALAIAWKDLSNGFVIGDGTDLDSAEVGTIAEDIELVSCSQSIVASDGDFDRLVLADG
jgi:hypothetical protein